MAQAGDISDSFIESTLYHRDLRIEETEPEDPDDTPPGEVSKWRRQSKRAVKVITQHRGESGFMKITRKWSCYTVARARQETEFAAQKLT